MPIEEVRNNIYTDHDIYIFVYENMSTTVYQTYIRQNSVSGNSAFQMNTMCRYRRHTRAHACKNERVNRLMEKINGTKIVDK